MAAFLTFTLRMIRRGPLMAPAQAEASGSLKPALKSSMMGDPENHVLAPAE
jgi:cytochrome d ubiquinol oxidase subunit I